MTSAGLSEPRQAANSWRDGLPLAGWLRSAVQPLLFGLRLWASVCLALYVAFWLELDNAFWAGTSAAIVCQPQLGASLRKGWFRMIGTRRRRRDDRGADRVLPAGARPAFSLGLALWGAACAFVATLLRNFAGLRGGAGRLHRGDRRGRRARRDRRRGADASSCSPSAAPAEICIGIVCAGIVLAGDRSRRRPAPAGRAARGAVGRDRRPVHRHRWRAPGRGCRRRRRSGASSSRRVIALDPVIDEAIGESSHLRYHSPVLQSAVGRTVRRSGRLARGGRRIWQQLPGEQARHEADVVLQQRCRRAASGRRSRARLRAGSPTRSRPHRACEAAVRGADRPAGRHAIAAAARRPDRRGAGRHGARARRPGAAGRRSGPISRAIAARIRLRVPDWLPAFVNGGARVPRHRRRCAVLDRDRLAERRPWPSPSPRSWCCCSRREPTRPTPSPSVFTVGTVSAIGSRRDRHLRGAAGAGDLRRLQPRRSVCCLVPIGALHRRAVEARRSSPPWQ